MASKNIQLPELGEGVTEGELIKWLVKPGDTIRADQAIAEMMTDKATVEVPSPAAGRVVELKGKEGDVVEVGQVMIVIDTEAGAAPGKTTQTAASAKAAASPVPTKPSVQGAPAPASGAAAGALKNVQLPELGEGVTEGELIKFLVKPGDVIRADQAIAEMMTDKATVEVPSPSAGTVKELKAKEGDVVEVGQVLIVIETSGGGAASVTTNGSASAGNGRSGSHGSSSQAPAQISVASVSAAAQTATKNFSSATRTPGPAVSSGGSFDFHPPVAEARVLATPATRRLAREMGVDINSLKGSGLAGRVTREDVAALSGGRGAGAVSAGAPGMQTGLQAKGVPRPAYQGPVGAAEERVAIRGIRKKIAENMQMAKQIIPHITIGDEANITALVNLREELKAMADKTGVKITYLPFVMKAMIAAMRDFPMFNASIDDAAQEIVYKKYFNLGFAADTPSGLMVPVIKNADQKTISQLGKEIAELGKKARDGKLALEEMKGATTTITNIGSFGGTFATPIINHPEVAILGMYRIQDKPVVKKGASGMEIDVIKSMNFTITADHRLIDGAVAVRFLQAFIARIENPGVLMLDMI